MVENPQYFHFVHNFCSSFSLRRQKKSFGTTAEAPSSQDILCIFPRSGRVNPIKTCTNGRWVASAMFICFQRPTHKGREACKPHREFIRHPVSVMWV